MGIDPDAFFLRALERWDTETQQRHKTGRPVAEAAARQRLKMPLFQEIVVGQARPAISVRSVRDAYLITLNERGALDFGRMAELLGPGGSQNENAVRDTLASEGLIFHDPEGGWQTADAYLSGNVKRKLQVATQAALAELRFQRNVEALQLVIPPNSTLDNKLAQAVAGASGFVRSVSSSGVCSNPNIWRRLSSSGRSSTTAWAFVRIVCSSCWMQP